METYHVEKRLLSLIIIDMYENLLCTRYFVCVCVRVYIYIHTHTHIHLITSIALSGWPQLRFLKKTEKLTILKITKLVSSGVILQNQTV